MAMNFLVDRWLNFFVPLSELKAHSLGEQLYEFKFCVFPILFPTFSISPHLGN